MKWIYLDTDFKKLNNLKKLLNTDNQININKRLKKIQYKNKDKFIDFIDNLSEKFNSIKWWSSQVSEKNVLVKNNLFMQICFIDLVLEYKNQDVLVISDNLNLLKTILKNCKSIRLLIKIKYNKVFDDLIRFYKTRRKFIFKSISNLKLFWYFRKYQNTFLSKIKNNCVGLITWIDKRNFKNDKFQENYFCEVFDRLKNTEHFILLPQFLYTYNKQNAINKLKNNNIRFIDYLSGYKFIDIIKSVSKGLFFLKPLLAKYIFDNRFDITFLIENIIKNEIIENKYADYYLKYYAVKRLKKKNLNFKKMYYPFENQPWEKILCYAFKKYSPATELIGYMHTMPLDFLLSIFPGKYEKKFMPQPDKILTTGKLSADELKKYYKEDKIVENCALRYEYLFRIDGLPNLRISELGNKKIIRQYDNPKIRQFKILVSLPVDYNKSLAIIDKVFKTFENRDDFQVMIKGHPTYNLRISELTNLRIIELPNKSKNIRQSDNPTIRESFLPENFLIVEDNISDLLRKTDLVINNMSMVAFEALKMRVPVIEIEIENFINLNRFDYCSDLKILAFSPEEILNKTNEILNWSEQQKQKYFEKADKFLDYCFNEPNEKYLQEFLEV